VTHAARAPQLLTMDFNYDQLLRCYKANKFRGVRLRRTPLNLLA